MRVWREIKRCLQEVLYPEGAVCLGCGKTARGECLCPACREQLFYSDSLESWEFRELQGVPAWSMRPHRGLSRELVLRLKYGAEARAAAELAGVLQTRPAFFPEFPPDTVVTWVPIPRPRLRERCVDHGQLLAEAVARQLGLTCQPLLARRGNDTPQARLDRERRQRNLKKAFIPLGKVESPVLLVDDVLTTGTTALRCIAALRQGGAKDITVLTCTRAVE
ncbi:MAG: ComF family protein [Clostridia bacterium]|nr:ComF family protein [Clostridia bacterium]